MSPSNEPKQMLFPVNPGEVRTYPLVVVFPGGRHQIKFPEDIPYNAKIWRKRHRRPFGWHNLPSARQPMAFILIDTANSEPMTLADAMDRAVELTLATESIGRY